MKNLEVQKGSNCLTEKENAPCTHLALCAFHLIGCAKAVYLRKESKDACVFYNYAVPLKSRLYVKGFATNQMKFAACWGLHGVISSFGTIRMPHSCTLIQGLNHYF